MQQSYYGADIGEFKPDQLRKLAELREIENLQFDPIVIVKLENMGYQVDIETGFAVENRNGEIEHCLGMYDYAITDMWSDFSSPSLSDLDGSSYITASVLWWWTLPELPPHTPAEMV